MEMYNSHTVKELCSNDKFKITLEELNGVLFIHCDVYEYCKSVLKELRNVFKVVKESAINSGYEEVAAYTQNKRFAKMMNSSFEVLGEIPSSDGNNFEVLLWELK